MGRLALELRHLRQQIEALTGAQSGMAPVEAPPAPLAAAAPGEAEGTAAGPERASSAPSYRKRLEERITARWMVWLGAVTIALAGTFLVKHAIDREWLTPLARVALGSILGIALIVAGAWSRRRPGMTDFGPGPVAAALTASGLFVAFASLYAAYALYGLIHPLLAFAALSTLALAGLALALLHGRFVAILGLLGGYLTPVLVHAAEPEAPT